VSAVGGTDEPARSVLQRYRERASGRDRSGRGPAGQRFLDGAINEYRRAA
jgi:hypothetical protein